MVVKQERRSRLGRSYDIHVTASQDVDTMRGDSPMVGECHTNVTKAFYSSGQP